MNRIAWIIFAFAIHCLSSATCAQQFYPVDNLNYILHDDHRNLLYITTDDGRIERLLPGAAELSEPLVVGGRPLGLDITPDGSYLYVAQLNTADENAVIHKVDLSDDSVVDLLYQRENNEGGANDIAITANDKAFTAGWFQGSGPVPVREIDLTNDTFTIRKDFTTGNSLIYHRAEFIRGADHSMFFGFNENLSTGPSFVYDATTDSFSPQVNLGGGLNEFAAVDRNGQFVAIDEFIYSGEDLSLIDAVPYISNAYAFDPIRDILYVIDVNTNLFIGYDYINLLELGRVPLNFEFDGGEMAISRDTCHVYVGVADEGVYYFENPLSLLLGDINFDRMVNLQDVMPFIDVLTMELFVEEADINRDGAVNLKDVGPFVDILINN